jgi:heme-degrading monooxygenase HmoA
MLPQRAWRSLAHGALQVALVYFRGSGLFYLRPVIVNISSVIVHQSHSARYLEHMRCSVLPCYEAAKGLVSVSFSQREMVAYLEVLTVSIWKSEDALRHFAESASRLPTDCALISLEPRVYKLLHYVMEDRLPE